MIRYFIISCICDFIIAVCIGGLIHETGKLLHVESISINVFAVAFAFYSFLCFMKSNIKELNEDIEQK